VVVGAERGDVHLREAVALAEALEVLLALLLPLVVERDRRVLLLARRDHVGPVDLVDDEQQDDDAQRDQDLAERPHGRADRVLRRPCRRSNPRSRRRDEVAQVA
jgi:hypothetical protein